MASNPLTVDDLEAMASASIGIPAASAGAIIRAQQELGLRGATILHVISDLRKCRAAIAESERVDTSVADSLRSRLHANETMFAEPTHD